MATRRGKQNIDWVTFSIYLTMIGVGWLMIYTVGYNEGYEGSSLDLLGSTMIGKQTIWIAISLLLLFLIQLVDWKFWRTFAFLVYGFGLVLLALNDVNMIRARAGVSAMSSMDAAGFLAERGREMYAESARRTDLIRFGEYNGTWWEKEASDAHFNIFPIPADQITAAGGSLTQNPGY